MQVIADLHIHSRFSRATSQKLTLTELDKFATVKGLNTIGTGDFTHPKWLKEITENLLFDRETRTFTLPHGQVKFIMTTEVCTVFESAQSIKKVHHVILTPDLELATQINERLAKYGDLTIDGRPTLNVDAATLVEEVISVSPSNLIFPAHCIPPQTLILTSTGLVDVDKIMIGEYVFTHLGRKRKVLNIFKRRISEPLVHITPYYFQEGFSLTAEHPVYAIRSYKNCRWVNGLCKPTCSSSAECRRKYYLNYTNEWVRAGDLRVGDILVYPIISSVEKKDVLEFSFKPVELTFELCRLFGYFLADGYINRDGLAFSFNKKERRFIRGVILTMKRVFEMSPKIISKHGAKDLVYYSKALAKQFGELFYLPSLEKRAWTKCMPNWMLFLPPDQQAEVLSGWWSGDGGSTTSRVLVQQIKFICLRLGLVPSIGLVKKQQLNCYSKKIDGRNIHARHDQYSCGWLSVLDPLRFQKVKAHISISRILSTKSHHGWVADNYFYIPIRKINHKKYQGNVYNLEVAEDNSYLSVYAAFHNCWTPWFGLFGALSGFDRIEDCYKDMTKHIHALETGLSSDPAMNWRLSALDRFTLVSNSDSHSFWPWRIGREANVFELKKVGYYEIVNAIRSKDVNQFKFTIETDPAYGKYHWTGHRSCHVSLSSADAKKLNGFCPVCRRKLTKGVEQRVDELADRPLNYAPEKAIGFVRLLPLSEIIAAVLNSSSPSTKRAWGLYNRLISKFGNEYAVLLNVDEDSLKNVVDERLAKAIIQVRQGAIKIIPGYDGVYGQLLLGNHAKSEDKIVKQSNISDFFQRDP